MEYDLCKCQVHNKCISKSCDCIAFCYLFTEEIEEIHASPKKGFMTISPDPRTYKYTDDCHRDWLLELEKLLYCTSTLLVSLELNASGNPHYHMAFIVTDPIKLYKTIQGWNKFHNVKKHNEFYNAYHYLFKETARTYINTGIVPVLADTDLKHNKQARRMKRFKEIEEEKHKELIEKEKEIPQWMRP